MVQVEEIVRIVTITTIIDRFGVKTGHRCTKMNFAAPECVVRVAGMVEQIGVTNSTIEIAEMFDGMTVVQSGIM